MILTWRHRRPSLLGTATGAVAGLVAITPAAGFVPPLAGIPIGIVATVICYYCMLFRMRRGIDESLDVWAVHDMGDGKIFVLPVDNAVRIRTGEDGKDAI